jgi:hypothetical protein
MRLIWLVLPCCGSPSAYRSIGHGRNTARYLCDHRICCVQQFHRAVQTTEATTQSCFLGPVSFLQQFPDFLFGDVERLCFVHRLLLSAVGFSWPVVSAEQRSPFGPPPLQRLHPRAEPLRRARSAAGFSGRIGRHCEEAPGAWSVWLRTPCHTTRHADPHRAVRRVKESWQPIQQRKCGPTAAAAAAPSKTKLRRAKNERAPELTGAPNIGTISVQAIVYFQAVNRQFKPALTMVPFSRP